MGITDVATWGAALPLERGGVATESGLFEVDGSPARSVLLAGREERWSWAICCTTAVQGRTTGSNVEWEGANYKEYPVKVL